jgi:hypothetical protein
VISHRLFKQEQGSWPCTSITKKQRPKRYSQNGTARVSYPQMAPLRQWYTFPVDDMSMILVTTSILSNRKVAACVPLHISVVLQQVLLTFL